MNTLERIVIGGGIGCVLLLSSLKAEGVNLKSVSNEQKQNKEWTLADTLGYGVTHVGLTKESGIHISLFSDINLNDYVNFADYNTTTETNSSVRVPLSDVRARTRKYYSANLAGQTLDFWFEYPNRDYFGDEALVCMGKFDGNFFVRIGRCSLNSLYIRRFVGIARQEILGYYAALQPTQTSEGYGSFVFWSKDLICEMARDTSRKSVLSFELGAADLLRYDTKGLFRDHKCGAEVFDDTKRNGFLSLQEIRPSAVTYLGARVEGSKSTVFNLDGTPYYLVYSSKNRLWHLRDLK